MHNNNISPQAKSNVGTKQQPQSAQQPQSPRLPSARTHLDSEEGEELRLEEEKAKEVEMQIQGGYDRQLQIGYKATGAGDFDGGDSPECGAGEQTGQQA